MVSFSFTGRGGRSSWRGIVPAGCSFFVATLLRTQIAFWDSFHFDFIVSLAGLTVNWRQTRVCQCVFTYSFDLGGLVFCKWLNLYLHPF